MQLRAAGTHGGGGVSLRVEDDARRARELLARPDVRDAMVIRCEEEGHDREIGLTAFFQVVRICKWCGDRR